MRKTIVAGVLAAGALGLFSANHFLRDEAIKTIDVSELNGGPVAIADTPHGKLFADYSFVYRLVGERLVRLKHELPDGWKWNPTDIVAAGGKLFIANYKGNDILAAELDEATNVLRVTRRIGDARSVSPEGVDYHNGKLAVANYDGNNVQVFSANAEHGAAAECDLEVKYAHGVAYSGKFLYATSLYDRKVVKIDPNACKIVASVGSAGWEEGQFLWPTSIADMGDGNLIVSDAHTGKLTVLSAADLSVKRVWGGNGPKAFNMPYGVAWIDGAAWVASTFNRTIVIARNFSWDKTKWFSFEKGAWVWKTEAFGPDHYISSRTRKGYDRKESVEIRGKCYIPSYSRVKRCEDGEPAEELQFPSSLHGSFMYFVQATPVVGGVLLSSPQNSFALFYPDSGGPAREVEIGLDTWRVGKELVGPSGPIKIVALPEG